MYSGNPRKQSLRRNQTSSTVQWSPGPPGRKCVPVNSLRRIFFPRVPMETMWVGKCGVCGHFRLVICRMTELFFADVREVWHRPSTNKHRDNGSRFIVIWRGVGASGLWAFCELKLYVQRHWAPVHRNWLITVVGINNNSLIQWSKLEKACTNFTHWTFAASQDKILRSITESHSMENQLSWYIILELHCR